MLYWLYCCTDVWSQDPKWYWWPRRPTHQMCPDQRRLGLELDCTLYKCPDTLCHQLSGFQKEPSPYQVLKLAKCYFVLCVEMVYYLTPMAKFLRAHHPWANVSCNIPTHLVPAKNIGWTVDEANQRSFEVRSQKKKSFFHLITLPIIIIIFYWTIIHILTEINQDFMRGAIEYTILGP